MIIAFILGALGLLLIFIEFFVPGGIMGVGGGLLIVLSCIFFLLSNPGMGFFLLYLLALGILLFAVIRLALWRVKATAKKNTIYHGNDQEGFQASSFEKEMIGKKGIAATDLRPSGHIDLEGKRVQATAKGGFVEKGTEVVVIGGEGSHLIVKKLV